VFKMYESLSKLSAALLVAAALGPLAAHAVGQHQFGNYRVTVAPDAQSVLSDADYQVTVENEELLLSRLTASYTGTLSNSFVADLNEDGGFEVVVTFSHPDGHLNKIHVYSWKEHLLQPMRVADLDDSQKLGYRGNDEFAIRNGQLIRMFQIYEEMNGNWSPTASRRQLRYSFKSERWTGE